jgi:hypothetical protein
MKPYPFNNHTLQDSNKKKSIEIRYEIVESASEIEVLANWSKADNCPPCPSPAQRDAGEYAKLAHANWTTYASFNRCAFSRVDLGNRCLVTPHDDFRIMIAARSKAQSDQILGFVLLRRSFAKSLQLEYLGVAPFWQERIKGLGTTLLYKSIVMARHLDAEVFYFEETVLSAKFYDKFRPTFAFHLGGLNAFNERDRLVTEKFISAKFNASEVES